MQLYGDLQASFPAPEIILGGRRESKENAVARLPTQHVLDNPAIASDWRDFFALHTSSVFWADIVRIFGHAMRAQFPGLEERAGRRLEDFRVGLREQKGDVDLYLECQFVINTPGTQRVSVKTPHVDKGRKIFAGLFYMRDPEDRSEGGDLEFYRWKRAPRFLPYRMILPEDVDQSCRIPYIENIFACFVNSPRSIHGVTPRGPSTRHRRYINVVAEVPFHAFETPRISLPARLFHWRQVRQIRRNKIGDDPY